MRTLQDWLVAFWRSIATRGTARRRPDATTGTSRSTSAVKRAISKQALIERYSQGDRDFVGVSLRDCLDLVGIDLRQADLSRSDLAGTCLAKARLDGAVLHLADMRNAQLYEASLQNADLRQANLAGANLLLTVLEGADLTGAEVSDASLASAYSLEGARMPDGSMYDGDTQVRLQEASLRQARASLDAHLRNESP
jgi:hypothetical protein